MKISKHHQPPSYSLHVTAAFLSSRRCRSSAKADSPLSNTACSFTLRPPNFAIKLLTKFATIPQSLPRHFLCRRLVWVAIFHSVSLQKLKSLPKNLPHRPLRKDQSKQVTQIMRPWRHHSLMNHHSLKKLLHALLGVEACRIVIRQLVSPTFPLRRYEIRIYLDQPLKCQWIRKGFFHLQILLLKKDPPSANAQLLFEGFSPAGRKEIQNRPLAEFQPHILQPSPHAALPPANPHPNRDQLSGAQTIRTRQLAQDEMTERFFAPHF